MATKIIMPKLGMAMTEGVVAKWNKRDGDAVAQDEEVAVVMSKKITYKLKAPEAVCCASLPEKKRREPSAQSSPLSPRPASRFQPLTRKRSPRGSSARRGRSRSHTHANSRAATG